MLQDRPVCFDCHEVIEHSAVFEAPCGHLECPSAAWHGLCLMRFRDEREAGERFEVVGLLVRVWSREHTENEGRPVSRYVP